MTDARTAADRTDRTLGWLSSDAFSDLVEAVRAHIEPQPRDEPEPWLDVAAGAAYLCCSAKRIYDLVALGQLRCARDGRRLLFRREWLDAALDL